MKKFRGVRNGEVVAPSIAALVLDPEFFDVVKVFAPVWMMSAKRWVQEP
jgi:hypothetical protein